MKTESELIAIAEQDLDDNKANESMKELRERFDPTYCWCLECDCLVVKEADCCLNKELEDENINWQ
jgi:hypothetical protein